MKTISESNSVGQTLASAEFEADQRRPGLTVGFTGYLHQSSELSDDTLTLTPGLHDVPVP
ncbi:MAG TPA: hypothetical protein VHZ09_10780 [Acidobacteriaceae bacterium]|nr:hypothetical protein [Acidobacteriaceae bacterium]